MSTNPSKPTLPGSLLGALTIGQAPRPDLLGPLLAAAPGWRWLEAGALDGIPDGWQPAAGGAYPLRTRLRDGTAITVAEQVLAPLLQEALRRLEAAGARLTVLLCAGTFDTLRPADSTLLTPFQLALEALRAAGIRRPLLLVPIAGQIVPAAARYRGAGFDAAAWAALLAPNDARFSAGLQAALADHAADGLLVDYVGHAPPLLEALAATIDRPVLALDALLQRALRRHITTGDP